ICGSHKYELLRQSLAERDRATTVANPKVAILVAHAMVASRQAPDLVERAATRRGARARLGRLVAVFPLTTHSARLGRLHLRVILFPELPREMSVHFFDA